MTSAETTERAMQARARRAKFVSVHEGMLPSPHREQVSTGPHSPAQLRRAATASPVPKLSTENSSCPERLPKFYPALLGSYLLLTACAPSKDDCRTTYDCVEGRYCVDSACVSVDPSGSCDSRWAGEDGCDTFSICTDIATLGSSNAEYRCQKGSACGLGDSCAGGFCNTGVIAEKEKLCFVDRCQSSSDCSMGKLCAFLLDTRLGVCQSGFAGQLCNDDDDCDIVSYCSDKAADGIGTCKFGSP